MQNVFLSNVAWVLSHRSPIIFYHSPLITRKASVAIIVKPDDSNFSSYSVLFIKRALNPRDRWSGHVACPGGHVEEHESPYQACLREVQEEVGLDLEAERTVFEPPVAPLHLQTSEVAGAEWIPLGFLLALTAPPQLPPRSSDPKIAAPSTSSPSSLPQTAARVIPPPSPSAVHSPPRPVKDPPHQRASGSTFSPAVWVPVPLLRLKPHFGPIGNFFFHLILLLLHSLSCIPRPSDPSTEVLFARGWQLLPRPHPMSPWSSCNATVLGPNDLNRSDVFVLWGLTLSFMMSFLDLGCGFDNGRMRRRLLLSSRTFETIKRLTPQNTAHKQATAAKTLSGDYNNSSASAPVMLPEAAEPPRPPSRGEPVILFVPHPGAPVPRGDTLAVLNRVPLPLHGDPLRFRAPAPSPSLVAKVAQDAAADASERLASTNASVGVTSRAPSPTSISPNAAAEAATLGMHGEGPTWMQTLEVSNYVPVRLYPFNPHRLLQQRYSFPGHRALGWVYHFFVQARILFEWLHGHMCGCLKRHLEHCKLPSDMHRSDELFPQLEDVGDAGVPSPTRL